MWTEHFQDAFEQFLLEILNVWFEEKKYNNNGHF